MNFNLNKFAYLALTTFVAFKANASQLDITEYDIEQSGHVLKVQVHGAGYDSIADAICNKKSTKQVFIVESKTLNLRQQITAAHGDVFRDLQLSYFHFKDSSAQAQRKKSSSVTKSCRFTNNNHFDGGNNNDKAY